QRFRSKKNALEVRLVLVDRASSEVIQKKSKFPKKLRWPPLTIGVVFTLSAAGSFVSVPVHRMSSSSPDDRPVSRPAFRLQEGGLLVVILLLGLLLTIFGGSVRMPEFRKNPAGETERLVVEKNKFLNARNLTQLAKDTSFIAIMAVGATFVIISGGIDLSVGAVYALASVLAALTLHYFGPDGPRRAVSPWWSVPR